MLLFFLTQLTHNHTIKIDLTQNPYFITLIKQKITFFFCFRVQISVKISLGRESITYFY